MYFNYTTTSISTVVRECIPKIDLTACSSNGSFTFTTLQCICNEEGCNNYVVQLEGTTTTPQITNSPTTITDSTTTTDEYDTSPGIGGANVKLPLLAIYYLLAFRLLWAF